MQADKHEAAAYSVGYDTPKTINTFVVTKFRGMKNKCCGC